MKKNNKYGGGPRKYIEDIKYSRSVITTSQTTSHHATKSNPSNWYSIIEAIKEKNLEEFKELLANSSTPTTLLILSPTLLFAGDLKTIINTIIRIASHEDAINYIQMIVERHPTILENVNNILASHNFRPITLTPTQTEIAEEKIESENTTKVAADERELEPNAIVVINTLREHDIREVAQDNSLLANTTTATEDNEEDWVQINFVGSEIFFIPSQPNS